MNDFPSLPSLQSVIARHDLLARKSLGQHFLLDSAITDTIARYAGKLDGCSVIEVGPGPGGLTRSLLKAGATVYAIEKDDRCIAILEELKEVFGERIHIIHGDALEVDVTNEVPAPRKIVANLPYNVGTQMLLTWLDAVYRQGQGAFESLTLMFQKEVAERIIATPRTKDYGRLTVLSQWLCECREDMLLPPEAFIPPPKVSSMVVTLTPRPKPLVDVSKAALEVVVAKAFNQRRKMLRQSLKGLAVPAELLLEKAGTEGSKRPEELDIEALCNLAKTYQSFPTNSAMPS